MGVVVKRFAKGTPHPRGQGLFCHTYGYDSAIAFFKRNFPSEYNVKTHSDWLALTHPVNQKLADDAWCMVWEEEENEFGRVMP